MASLDIDVAQHPARPYRIDRFTVPAAVRTEFEAALHRSAALLRSLPGFLGHVVFAKAGGGLDLEIVTIAMWESREAAAQAGVAVRAHYQQIGFDMQATLAAWGVVADLGNYTTPPELQ